MERLKISCTTCQKKEVILLLLRQLAVSYMHPRFISIDDYIYFLPEEKIAKHPLPERDASKLLVYRNGGITTSVYRSIHDYLPADSLLIFNNTKVVEARILFQKPSGGVIEIFCLEPHEQYPDIATGLLQPGKVWWKCLIGGAGKWKPGQVLQKTIASGTAPIILTASYIEKQSDCFVIELAWTPAHLSFSELLHVAGLVPLPPYIKRNVEIADTERYQTIYAGQDGSVAAPTAGLHFTATVFEKLKEKNIQPCFVTLHVGAGTFKPVKSNTMQDHEMHAEFIEVSKATITQLLPSAGNIYAVGTTSVRTLESIYWMGVKTIRTPSLQRENLFIDQWEVYETLQQHAVAPKQAIESLLNWMERNQLARLLSKTQILIAPGYSFKMVKGLVTNFHQPQSTLLLLVAALIGEDWKKIYDYALMNNFRFLSYGDGCLLEASI